MIPAADNCNHQDVTVVQEIIHKGLHLIAPRKSAYFTKTKYMNDYTINYEESDYANDPIKTANVKGRYNKQNFEENKQFTSIQKMKDALQAGIQLWDVPCIRETYTEDNDTEEDDESDEEESKESSKMLNTLNSMLSDRKATMKDIKKGFVFFMDQEKRDLKKHIAI